ncbi:winged helix family transcriptional regulator [Microbacterium oleivorans]|uniref:Winged helix family transcriptional regulator n=1 Tax=Microbacterium oleivorans TaxID=273677 RepID=A0A4V3B3U1_9MICO|nr:winged helix family transcriptional regulator [Microbacterium oleivorans]
MARRRRATAGIRRVQHPSSRLARRHRHACGLGRSRRRLSVGLSARRRLLLRRQNGGNGGNGDHVNAHDLHAIEVHVMNLRRKLGGTARRCRWIETVRGIGYRFAPAKL